MLCPKARRLIDENSAPTDQSLRDHLLNCESCASYERVARLVDSNLKSAGNVGELPAFSTVKNKIISLANSQSRWSQMMSKINSSISTQTRFVIPAAAVVVFLLFASLVPLPHSVVVGYDVTMEVKDDNKTDPALIKAALSTTGLDKYEIVTTPRITTTEYRLVTVARKGDATLLAQAVTEMSDGLTITDIEPVSSTVSSTLLAMLVDADNNSSDAVGDSRVTYNEGTLRVKYDSDKHDVWSQIATDKAVKSKVESLLEKIGVGEEIIVSSFTDKTTGRRMIGFSIKPDSVARKNRNEKNRDNYKGLVGYSVTNGEGKDEETILVIRRHDDNDSANTIFIMKKKDTTE